MLCVCQKQIEKVVYRAPFQHEAPIHIGLANGERRIKHELTLRALVGNAGSDQSAVVVTELVGATITVDQSQVTGRHGPLKEADERAKHLISRAES